MQDRQHRVTFKVIVEVRDVLEPSCIKVSTTKLAEYGLKNNYTISLDSLDLHSCLMKTVHKLEELAK